MAPQDETVDAVLEWRASQFEEIGFSTSTARVLAECRDDQGFPIYWADVRKLLDAGCPHWLAWEIVT